MKQQNNIVDTIRSQVESLKEQPTPTQMDIDVAPLANVSSLWWIFLFRNWTCQLETWTKIKTNQVINVIQIFMY